MRLPTDSDLNALELAFGQIVERDVSLQLLSHWRIGGTADIIVRPTSLEQLQQLRQWLSRQNIKHIVVGATTNLLFSDQGLRAVAVQLTDPFTSLRVEGTSVIAGAGAWVPQVARLVMKSGLTGLEHICGIPGQLGGLLYMNGGSQRRGVGNQTFSVTSVDASGDLIRRTQSECLFSYRTSVFQQLDEIITEVTLGPLMRRPTEEIRKEMLQILSARSRKFPRRLPNCGSVFVSDPQMYAEFGPPGAVLERLGFKGRQIGAAQFSPLHANFINNLGGATATDVLSLISLAKNAVADSTGYSLAVEARYVDESGDIDAAG